RRRHSWLIAARWAIPVACSRQPSHSGPVAPPNASMIAVTVAPAASICRLPQSLGSEMIVSVAFATTPGNTYAENQDAVLLDGVHQGRHEGGATIDAPRILLGIADGLAVSPCAARASRTALELLGAAYRKSAPLSD